MLYYLIELAQAILAQGRAVRLHPCKRQGWQPPSGGLCLGGGWSWPRCFCAPRADSPCHFLMPMAQQTEHEDMAVVAISLAGAGAFFSIGNVTSRASSSLGRCLFRRPCFALHDAQVLARAFALLGVVMLAVFFELIVVAAAVLRRSGGPPMLRMLWKRDMRVLARGCRTAAGP